MRLARIGAGILAGAIATPAAVFSAMSEVRAHGSYGPGRTALVFGLVAAGILWVGDRFGLIEEPYRKSVVDLYSKDDHEPPPAGRRS